MTQLLKHARIIQREAREAARASGIHVEVVGAGKHLSLEFSGPDGRHRRLAVSCTPKSTHHAIDNTRKYVQRIIAEMT